MENKGVQRIFEFIISSAIALVIKFNLTPLIEKYRQHKIEAGYPMENISSLDKELFFYEWACTIGIAAVIFVLIEVIRFIVKNIADKNS